MKIFRIDRKENLLEVLPENIDDLWQLQQIIQEKDIVCGSAERKVKAKEEGMKATKERIFIELETEKTEFHKPTGQLRVLGIIVAGKPEDFVQLKSHHTLEIELNKKVKIKKTELKQFEIEKIKKAEKSGFKPKIAFLVLDDEQADFAELKDFGFQIKATIKSGKRGKRYVQDSSEEKFFNEILQAIKQLEFKKIVIAGPGFTKTNFQKFLENKNQKFNAFFSSANSVGITGLNELLKSKALEKVLEQASIAEESKIIEEFFVEIAKQSAVALGFEETKKAAEAGAIEELFVSEKTFLEERKKIDETLKKAEQQSAKIRIISSGHEAGQKLDGIGGIAARLRYKLG
jgi:protein pelota